MKAIVDLFREYAEQSIATLGLEEKTFSIGGFVVRLRFAGAHWSAILTKALDHLRSHGPAQPGRRELTISVLDGLLPQRNPLLRFYLKALVDHWPDYTGPRGELLNLHGGPVQAFYHPGPDILSIVDLEEDLGFFWKRDLSPLPYYEAGSPMRGLLHAWMSRQGVQFVHGGAVGTESGGVLLVGKKGSGKSTSVLACFDSGLKYASDDYCMVGAPDSKHWEVYSLYNTAKLVGESDLAKFGSLAPHVWNPQRASNEKATIFLNESFPQKLIPHFPLRAILVPTITGQVDTRIEACGEGAALMALGPSSLAQLPASGPWDLSAIAQLVRSSPCFRLQLGTDLTQIPGAIGQLLSQLSP
jgi:hypothetical protein